MIGARAKLALALAACLAPCAAPMTARAQSAAELYYERGLMSVAGARCGLFDADIAAALGAAQAQARNAALRGGQSPAVLDATLGRAQATATTTPCNNSDLSTAAQRVRQAFKAYAGLRAMSFPGDFASWKAVRAQTVSNTAWRLSQSASAGPDRITFGLAGKQGQDQVTVAAAFADGQTPYAARLVLRDPARAPAAYIGALAGKARVQRRLAGHGHAHHPGPVARAGGGDPAADRRRRRGDFPFPRFRPGVVGRPGPARVGQRGFRVRHSLGRRGAPGLFRGGRLRRRRGLPALGSALRIEGDHLGARAFARLWLGIGRQAGDAHRDRGAFAQGAFDDHLAAVQFGEGAHQR